MKNFRIKIERWSYKRGLLQRGELKSQTLKLQEEAGETARAVLRNDRAAIEDGIGDCFIVLTNLAKIAERHFRDQCSTCRGIGGEFATGPSGESDVWIDCKDCGQMDIETCIEKAYNQIKNRTGKMTNGTFIKDNNNDAI